MNINEAEIMAKELIAKHCPSFKFKFMSSKKLFGQCSYSTKKKFNKLQVFGITTPIRTSIKKVIYYNKVIKLSKSLTEINSADEVKDVVLHEIAHALTFGHGHDKIWKRKAIELGAKPERCYGNEVLTPPPNYQFTCLNCNKIINYYRMPKKDVACGNCCAEHNNGKYDKRFILVMKKQSYEK